MADCINNKVDSNSVGLSYAEEVCAKQLPNLADDGHDPIWYGLEPNSFADDFGGDITSLARKPINANRRNKKGTIVDLDAAAGWNEDVTQHNMQRLFSGFFFSNFREKASTKPLVGTSLAVSGFTATNSRVTVAAGLLDRGFRTDDLVFISGARIAGNNGLHQVESLTNTTIDFVDAEIEDETVSGYEVMITMVGHSLLVSDCNVVMSGSLPVLTLETAAVAATGALTIASAQNAVANETVTLGDIVYTWKASGVNPYEVTIGGSRVVSAANLRKAINGLVLGTPAHPQFTATDNGAGVVTVTAIKKGLSGNGYASTETMTQGSWAAVTTSGGLGFSMFDLEAGPGEWLFLGGDDIGTAFQNNTGYGRIGSMTDTTIVFDKTTWTPEAEDGTGLTIQVFVGSTLRDEDAALQVTKYFQFERTLGEDADGTQAEYVRGSVANELKLVGKLADKINVDLKFMASDTSVRTGAQGLKAGTRFASLGEDAFNTTSDVVRINMAVLDPATSVPTGLFAYATELTLEITNNAEAVKVLGHLGGIDVSAGNFDVSGQATVLFTTVEAINAVRQNADVTFDMISAKLNHGFVWDIPLLGIGGAKPKIEENKPVTLPITMNGAENPNSYTAMYINFEYLPTVAMPEQSDTDA